MRTSLGSPSLGSTGSSSLDLGTASSSFPTVVFSSILRPTLYPLFILMIRTSGELNSWCGIRVPAYSLPSLTTSSLDPSVAPREASFLESESE